MSHDLLTRNLLKGIPINEIPTSSMVAGKVNGKSVLLARLSNGDFLAVDGQCTHYGGPLAEGLLINDEVRCPWHHACFNLRSGEAIKAPAFSPLTTWQVEVKDGVVSVTNPKESAPSVLDSVLDNTDLISSPDQHPKKVVIIGAGAAGFSAALRLRELGYKGSINILGKDNAAPYDRPNLSKDYLAGTAPPEWIPLRDQNFYVTQKIELHTGCDVESVDPKNRVVKTKKGQTFDYDSLLFAMGSKSRQLSGPNFNHPNILTLRTLADADELIKRFKNVRSVALIGAGFIGMEVASALKIRNLDVHVIAPDQVPLERILGHEVGLFLLQLHKDKGVHFHLGQGCSAKTYDGHSLLLENGESITADLVIAGIGAIPETELAEKAGLRVDNGILVNKKLQTSIPNHYAAGDVARYPWSNKKNNETDRIEHWVHAQRQGQAAAANMLGANKDFTDVPFFWSHQQGVELRYCGHGRGWDNVKIDGDFAKKDFTARYFKGEKLIAAASVGRDQENLRIEDELSKERG